MIRTCKVLVNWSHPNQFCCVASLWCFFLLHFFSSVVRVVRRPITEVQAYFATQQLDTTDARELFNLLDQDGDGEAVHDRTPRPWVLVWGGPRTTILLPLLEEEGLE